MNTKMVIVFIVLMYINKVTAQNINGDTILVSAETQTWITFYSPPNGQVTKDASSFSITGTGKSLAIEPLKPNTRTTTLMVQEGSRTHQFIVYYKEDIDPSQSVYNFSDLKLIERKIKEKATVKTASPPPVAAANTASESKPASTTVSKEAQDFALAISTGDDAFEKERYTEALAAFKKALLLKSNNEYSKTKITAINKILAEKEKLALKLQDENYNNSLLKAAKAFTGKKYEEAKAGYREALDSRPNDKFATNQIVAIDKMIADEAVKQKEEEVIKQQEETYKTTIVSADKALASEDFETAKSYYSLASSYKPNESYPKKKLEETERRIVALTKDKENKERETLYKNTLSKAKSASDTKNYEMSKELYNEALNLKPNDEYVKTQLKAIDKAIASQAQKELEEKKNSEAEQSFKEAMTLADNAYKAENYDVAKTEYKKALSIKSDNRAENQIKSIDAILEKEKEKATTAKEQQAKEALKNNNYDQAVKKAENFFNKKDYTNARIAYKQALNYKDEQGPKDKLAEIESILGEMEAKSSAEKEAKEREAEVNKNYNAAIAKAKTLELNNDYDNAKLAYLEALQLKPSDPTPKARIEALDKKVTEIETDKKYNAAIAKGNVAIGERQFNDALESFREALRLKPLESYPLKQITYVESVVTKDAISQAEKTKKAEDVAGEAERIQNFNDGMAAYKRGETALNERRWQDALGEYENFLRLIPDTKELNNYQYNAAGAIEFAKRKIIDLRNYLNRLKGSTFQADAIPYSQEDLTKKYPDINFTTLPQSIRNMGDSAPVITKLSKDVAAEPARQTLADSVNSIKLTFLGLSKKGNYLYMKLRVMNNSSADFLTGQMLLTATKKKKTTSLDPVYISAFPVILPGKEFSIVYATKDYTVADGDALSFELNDRSKKTSVKLPIPGSVFNQEKNR